MKVAIPRFGESVAPCFGASATVTIFTIDRRKVVEQFDFCLQSADTLDRVRLLRDQQVDTLICGGLESRLEDMVQAHGIEVISWVSGSVDSLLQAHLKGELIAGTGRLGSPTAEQQQHDPEEKEPDA
ncbi:MAG: hypothetical protein A2289_18410 [Deltaproteobacteria bacterium RIFOXYA12_FULL_58_15]|nr:MAG: hypothetical protein A2289_18410 [Deltaproteobacteria bacterium RIFOXYA12_FULL_58_15]